MYLAKSNLKDLGFDPLTFLTTVGTSVAMGVGEWVKKQLGLKTANEIALEQTRIAYEKQAELEKLKLKLMAERKKLQQILVLGGLGVAVLIILTRGK